MTKPGDTLTMKFEDLTPELQAAVLRGEKIVWAKPPAACEVDGCVRPVAHGEHFHERMRLWCEEHTPWSGHYEHCPDDCHKVLAKHGLQPPRDIEEEIDDAFEASPYIYDQILCVWKARDGWRLCSKNGDRIDVWKVRDDGDGHYDFTDFGTIDP